MTDPDLQRLADLWTEPDGAEQEAFEALARKARLRGRIFAYLDITAVAIILGGAVLAMFMKPGAVTMFAAIALIVVTVIVTRKRRQIKQMTRTLDTAGRQAFIETSISNATANLRRTRLSLAFFPVGAVIALTFKMSVRTGGHSELMWAAFLEWAPSPRGIITFVILALLFAWGLRTLWRIKCERRRLEELRAAYAEEAEYEETRTP
jgi:membrane protein implicated in regulation of membrane protease activity